MFQVSCLSPRLAAEHVSQHLIWLADEEEEECRSKAQ